MHVSQGVSTQKKARHTNNNTELLVSCNKTGAAGARRGAQNGKYSFVW